jgi:hypothetical protein
MPNDAWYRGDWDHDGEIVPGDRVIRRDVPGHEGYRAGEDGSVWSRWAEQSRPAALGDVWHRVRPVPRGDGYRHVSLITVDPATGRQRREQLLLHRVVALAFHGGCPEGWRCFHVDGNKDDNSATNLAYRPPTRPRKTTRGLTEEQRRQAWRFSLCGHSTAEIARYFGVAWVTARAGIARARQEAAARRQQQPSPPDGPPGAGSAAG